jgi:4-amino-4-deoxy-L-arabinose transferase-like glycosyltransferase
MQTTLIKQYALVAGITLVVMFWNLSARSIDDHEAFVAVTVRTMTNSAQWIDRQGYAGIIPPNTDLNHWLVPVFNGIPRLVKTPLAYWTVAGAVRLGLPPDEFAARLPSALAALAVVLVTFSLGRRLVQPKAALFGAVLLSTSLGMYTWGRNARPEMFLTLWMTVAMASLHLGIHAQRALQRFCWLITAGVSLGLANLSKEFVPYFLILSGLLYLSWRAARTGRSGDEGATKQLLLYLGAAFAGLSLFIVIQIPAGYLLMSRTIRYTAALMLVGSPILWFMLRSGIHREIFPLMSGLLPAFAISAALFLPWLWYMSFLFPETASILSGQVIERGMGSRDLSDIISGIAGWYYFLALAKYTLPWSLLLPFALLSAIRDKEDRDGRLFLFCWIAGLVLLFSISEGKRPHYILPALPAASLLAGSIFSSFFSGNNCSKALWIKWTCWITSALIAAATMVVLFFVKDISPGSPPGNHFLMLALFLIAALAVCGIFAARGRITLTGQALIATVLVVWIIFAGGENLWDRNAATASFAKEAAKHVPADETVAGLGPLYEQVIYYFGRDIPALMSGGDGAGPRWIFGPYDRRADFENKGFSLVLDSGPLTKKHRKRMALYRRI